MDALKHSNVVLFVPVSFEEQLAHNLICVVPVSFEEQFTYNLAGGGLAEGG